MLDWIHDMVINFSANQQLELNLSHSWRFRATQFISKLTVEDFIQMKLFENQNRIKFLVVFSAVFESMNMQQHATTSRVWNIHVFEMNLKRKPFRNNCDKIWKLLLNWHLHLVDCVPKTVPENAYVNMRKSVYLWNLFTFRNESRTNTIQRYWNYFWTVFIIMFLLHQTDTENCDINLRCKVCQ